MTFDPLSKLAGVDLDKPLNTPERCADCDELIWWNPRKRQWRHTFEHGCAEAIPNAPTVTHL